ncbi:hypothetical protein ABPG77_003294 [Micractinium sp. CCAP 211/92]
MGQDATPVHNRAHGSPHALPARSALRAPAPATARHVHFADEHAGEAQAEPMPGSPGWRSPPCGPAGLSFMGQDAAGHAAGCCTAAAHCHSSAQHQRLNEQQVGHSSTSWTVDTSSAQRAHAAGSTVAANTSQTPDGERVEPACGPQQMQPRCKDQQQQALVRSQPAWRPPQGLGPQAAAGSGSLKAPAPDLPLTLRAGTVSIVVSSPHVELLGPHPDAKVQHSHRHQQKQQRPRQQQILTAAAPRLPDTVLQLPGSLARAPHVLEQQPPAAAQSVLPAGAGRHCRAGPATGDDDPLRSLQALVSAEGSPQRSQHDVSGRGPRSLSAAAALPSRLAAQQLDGLAGMGRKVQEAIGHSQRLLEQQAALVELAVLARSFYAWRHHQALQQLRRQAAVVAARQVELGRARRCVHAWRQQSGRLEERLLPRAKALLRRSLLARCWREWRRVCGLRWWKLQLELRDGQLQQLGAQLRRAESRPVRLMLRYRLRALLSGWQWEARYQSAKQAACSAAERQARRAALCAALGGWLAVASEKAAARWAVQRAQQRLSRLRMRHTLLAWRDELGAVAGRHAAKQRACQLWRCNAQRRVLRGWRFIAWFRRTSRLAAAQKQLRLAATAYEGWRQQAELLAVRQRLLRELLAARAARLLSRAFGAWLAAVEGVRSRQQADALDRLGLQAEQLAGENAWLKKECERLGRVIDSGDWGQQRVQELLQAGRVLREERDGLAALVGALQAQQAQQGQPQRGQHEPATLSDSGAEQRDINGRASATSWATGPPEAALQQGGLLGVENGLPCQAGFGSGPLRPPSARLAEPGRAVAARNRLLVQSGSSFNALVRALKQDLVATGGLQRAGPVALLEVDKLSLHSVTAATDGGLAIEAVGSPDRRGVAFGCNFPPSPTRKAGLAGPAAGVGVSLAAARQPPSSSAGAAVKGSLHLPASTARKVCDSSSNGPSAAAPGASARGLLEAAMRIQGIGGRSVGLGKAGQ